MQSIPSQTPGCRICKEFLKLNEKKTNDTNIKGVQILDRHITKEDVQIFKKHEKMLSIIVISEMQFSITMG